MEVTILEVEVDIWSIHVQVYTHTHMSMHTHACMNTCTHTTDLREIRMTKWLCSFYQHVGITLMKEQILPTKDTWKQLLRSAVVKQISHLQRDKIFVSKAKAQHGPHLLWFKVFLK